VPAEVKAYTLERYLSRLDYQQVPRGP